MKRLIQASLSTPHAVIVMSLAIAVLGSLSLMSIPRCWLRMIVKTDLLPSPRLAGLLDEATQLAKIIGHRLSRPRGSKKLKDSNDCQSQKPGCDNCQLLIVNCQLSILWGIA
jgi:hypothetical protein